MLLSTYRSRGDVEPMMGLAVQLGPLGPETRMCAPVDLPPHAAEACDAPAETGVISSEVWR